MGKMSELSMEIEDLLDEGMDVTTIAHNLNVPLNWVISAKEDLTDLDDYDDSLDGDHASALASAGWGTDEDYGGGFAEEF